MLTNKSIPGRIVKSFFALNEMLFRKDAIDDGDDDIRSCKLLVNPMIS